MSKFLNYFLSYSLKKNCQVLGQKVTLTSLNYHQKTLLHKLQTTACFLCNVLPVIR